MRGVTIGAITGCTIGLVVSLIGFQQTDVWAQQPAAVPPGQILMMDSQVPGGGNRIVLVDTSSRVMASYIVDGNDGKITLASVRDFRWDLLMSAFNATEPTPKNIRAIVEQGQR